MLSGGNHTEGEQVSQAGKDVRAEPSAPALARPAVLCLQGWEGYTETPVSIVRETPKRFVVRLLRDMRLPSRRWGKAGEEVYVPKHSVKEVRR